MNVKNIYCVGRNYKLHAQELGNDVPTKPMIFSKPTHALAFAEGQTITLPSDRGAIHYEVEMVVHVNKSYEKGIKAKECIDKIAVGIDFTMRDVQDQLKKKGYPWLLAKGFPNSAVISTFFDITDTNSLYNAKFSLLVNEKIVQIGEPNDMIFSLDEIVSYCGENFGLGQGDIIFTGTPAGVGAVSNHDQFRLIFENEEKGLFKVKL